MKIIKFKKTIISFLGVFFIILPISPIANQPTIIEKPDFLSCLIFAWLVIDPKNSSLVIIIFLSFLADILWHRPLGLWPILVLIGAILIKFMMTKISLERFFLKYIYFTLFLFCIDTCIYITSLIGMTEQLDFMIWINRFIFSTLAFPLVIFLLEKLFLKNLKSSNSKL